MYGLRLINNHYAGNGNGRDLLLLRNQEFVHGRSKPLPFMSDQSGKLCLPKRKLQGRPTSLSQHRLTELYHGDRTRVQMSPVPLLKSTSETWLAVAKRNSEIFGRSSTTSSGGGDLTVG
eukprot:TRINITY_DN77093_c0_g1_i1.p1 TRINITY_DN77093_c0_g1~~TRINITY_DN77093_c0_g1_i1.p1  ORF type:complete len:119 (-),score=23.59 TRINITY_DN77093_c0_g1_i1:62-418(-)